MVIAGRHPLIADQPIAMGGTDLAPILFGLPAFPLHALPTLASIVAGIAVALSAMRLAAVRLPKISCGRDICRSTL